MKIKLFCLLLILLATLGCSDERLAQPMERVFFDGGEGNGVAPQGTLGPPPPEIQELLWGDWDTLLDALITTAELERGEDNPIGTRIAIRRIRLTTRTKRYTIRNILMREALLL